jgi:hypothetical protein
MEPIKEIFAIFADAGGISGLVILLLFIMIYRDLRDLKKQNEALRMQNEESKNEIQLQIEKTKSCVLKIMYEFNMCADRRKRNRAVKEDRRHTPNDI